MFDARAAVAAFRRITEFAIFSVMAVLFSLIPSHGQAQNGRPECIREAGGPAVVRVIYSYKTASNDPEEQQGTGFLISTNGYLLTAAHVVRPAPGLLSAVTDVQIKVSVGSMFTPQYTANLITKNDDFDIALLKIPALAAAWPTVQLDFMPAPEKRTWLYGLGFPSGTDLTGAGPGAVTSANAVIDEKSTQLLTTNVPLNQGMSGGPIFNEFGEVSGIAAAMKSTSGGTISYVVPINLAANFISTMGLPDYKKSLCADDYRDIVVEFVRDAVEGKYDRTIIVDQLWEVIQAQTNGTGKYDFLDDLGAMTALDVLNQNHMPLGTSFMIKTKHANGSMVWGVNYNRFLGKIEWASSNPQIDQRPANPTPVIVGTYSVCVGEKADQCFGHEHAPCGTDIKGWSRVMCRNRHQTQLFDVTPLSSRGGNQCGYAVFDVACMKP